MNQSNLGKRVAIVGTHCSGKTALVHGLVSKLREMNVNAGLAREAARLSYYLASNTITLEMQLDLLAKQVSEEMDAIRSHKVVICDRSVLDVLVYTDLFFSNLSLKKQIAYYDAMFRFTSSYITTYELVFRTVNFFDPKLSEDEIRIKDDTSQIFIHNEIKKRLCEFGVVFYDLPQKNIYDFIIDKMMKHGIFDS